MNQAVLKLSTNTNDQVHTISKANGTIRPLKISSVRMIRNLLFIFCISLMSINKLCAQNPIIRNQFSADPSARIFGDSVYVFPSHDIGNQGKGRENWFCMEDYHVFASANLTHWKDHSIILSHNNVEWVDTSTYSMWAPDCVERNGLYYLFFPAIAKDTIIGRGIGVAIANKPSGPFIPQKKPIKNVRGIDPNVFIDKDGQAYLYWSLSNIKGGNVYVAKLKDNMLELATEPAIIPNLPVKGLIEGPWMFERNGIYYLTYPHVEHKTERLEYATGNNPLGPFIQSGVIMDESPVGCWTNHHSILEYKNQWYLFYHHNDYSPSFDKNRAVRIDSIFFNTDGTIQKVIPTLRGVGVTSASKKIQIDRYSRIGTKGISIVFNDIMDPFKAWKTVFNEKDAWIQYNAIDFGKANFKTAEIRVASKKGGNLQLRLNNENSPVVANVRIPTAEGWQTVHAIVSGLKPGVHNLIVTSSDRHPIEVDWVRFKE